jgi:hypothetical protein
MHPFPFSFRDLVAEDFKNTFLNVDELGRIRDWNGTPLLMAEGAAPPILESVNSPGTLVATKEVYCRIEDMPREPKATEAVRLDGEVWYVVDCRTLLGHRIIQLGRHTS